MQATSPTTMLRDRDANVRANGGVTQGQQDELKQEELAKRTCHIFIDDAAGKLVTKFINWVGRALSAHAGTVRGSRMGRRRFCFAGGTSGRP